MDYGIEDIAKQEGILKTLVTDLSGGFKEIIVSLDRLPEIISSGIAYDGSSFQGINTINSSDSILKGIPESLVKVPESISDSDKPEYWIICSIMDVDGSPHPNCARGKVVELQDDLARTWERGNMYMGSEPEAYFIKREKKADVGEAGGGNTNYFNPKSAQSFLITELFQTLNEMGFEMERAHTEVGDDQFEANWKFDTAERTADKIQIYKLVCHKIARIYGMDVTFLPKPYPSRNGSGMHCHLSVSNEEKNLFYDEAGYSRKYFSGKALSFLTGILENARSLSAIANPTEVSYARLVPGFEAPCVIAIGDRNRSAACRIPAITDESTRSKGQRVEFRFPDPLANPYLLAAGFIAAGLIGVEKNAEFKGFCEEDLYAYSLHELTEKGYTLLPRNLWEAYQEFTGNEALRQKLGTSLFTSHAELLLEEIETCQAFANPESIRKHYLK